MAGSELANVDEMALEGLKPKTKIDIGMNLKKSKHQILNFKNQTFHLLPLTILCFFFLLPLKFSPISITLRP